MHKQIAHCSGLAASMTKSKFYAVRKGLAPGIYRTWDECKQQVHGVSGAAYQSFKTQQAAEQYLEARDVALVSSSARKRKRTTACQYTDARGYATTIHVPSELPDAAHADASCDRVTAQQHEDRDGASPLPSWVDFDMLYRLVCNISASAPCVRASRSLA